jgi:orotate phosphoribosyltransferase
MKNELALRIYEAVHRNGEFHLRSGIVSGEYFDKYLFESDPKLLLEIASEMEKLIPDETEVIAGLEMGGIPLVTALSIHANKKAVYVRKKAKEYGTCKLAEGVSIVGKKVCVIEDIVTTGGQIVKSVDELRKRGAEIDTVLCVIQRSEEASEALRRNRLELKLLFTMKYIESQL